MISCQPSDEKLYSGVIDIIGQAMPKKKPTTEKRSAAAKPAIAEDPKRTLRLFTYVVLILLACMTAGGEFLDQAKSEFISPAPERKLSNYLRNLKKTRGDTEVYLYKGKEPGGTALILGGTHPNEPASMVTAVLLAENIRVTQGTVIVITRANNSGFTATEPQEGYPSKFTIESRSKRKRSFRIGSRFTNILDGWPDPTVYEHHPSRQVLSGNETRNLNRAYPGKANGTLTERIAYAITELIRQEKVDLVIDLHEAAPEYPVINAVVAHESAMDVAAIATMDLQMLGLDFRLEPSPSNFHGLSHRELGDATSAYALLMESAGALQGRLRGKTDKELVTKSIDPVYHKADQLGRLCVDFPEEGIPLEVRVGRHLEGIKRICAAMTEFEPGKAVSFSRVPGYEEVMEHGVGFYLK